MSPGDPNSGLPACVAGVCQWSLPPAPASVRFLFVTLRSALCSTLVHLVFTAPSIVCIDLLKDLTVCAVTCEHWECGQLLRSTESQSVLLTPSRVKHTCDLAEDPFPYDLSEFSLNHVFPVSFVTGVLHISMDKKGRKGWLEI